MNRRHFLRNVMVVSGSGLLPSHARSQSRRSDVIVIGAGMAGLIATRELVRAGMRVLLLEGRSRVGGRMLSVVGPSEHGIELGAQVVHGTHAPTHRVLAELGVATRPIARPRYLRMDSSGVLLPRNGKDTDALYAAFLAAARAHRGADVSAQALMDTMELDAVQHEALASDPLSYAAEPDEISMLSLLDYSPAWDGLVDRNYQVVGGYGRVAEMLAEEFVPVLRLNTRVESIRWRRGRVAVTAVTPAGQQRFQAAAAVVTLPLAVLRAGHVEFEPALPSWKQSALLQLGMGRVVVQQMTFQRDFWSEGLGGADGWLMLGGRVRFTAAHGSGEGPPALTAWVTGRATEALAALEPPLLQEEILGWIAAAFPRSGVARLKRWIAHKDWQRDPFTLGAYSYTRPGGRQARGQLATPLQGALFFAGEATIGPPNYQTVHGAYLTGLRAAREVLAQLESPSAAS